MGWSHQGSGVDTLDDGHGHSAHVPRVPHGRDEVFVTASAHPNIDALQRWDLLVATTPWADVAQLSAWARVRRQAGCVPLFVFAETAGALVGGALVLHCRHPGFGDIGILPYGSVLRPDADRAPIADAICRAIAGLAGRGLAALFVQPPREAEDISRRLLDLGFRPFADECARPASLEFDLSRPTSGLQEDLSPEARGGVQRASAHGVHVRSRAAADLPVVAELLGDTAAQPRCPPIPSAYLQTLYRHLEQENHIKIFIAEHDGVPLATDVLTCSGDVTTLRSTGMRRSAKTPSGTAALLRWTALLWAKGNGYARFDVGAISSVRVGTAGVGRNGPASRLNGRDCFTASFGGQPFHYPEAVELFSSTAADRSSDLAHRSGLGQRVVERARRVVRRTRGPMTIAGLPGNIFHSVVKPPYVHLRRAFRRLMFDRRYGVRTEERVSPDELGLPSPDSIEYAPAGQLVLRRILSPSEVTPDDVFVDVGSGMGRVVLQAAMFYPFRRVLGIEISARLHEVSVVNLASNKSPLRCSQVELIHADIRDVELPDDVTVVFLYNPFIGATFQAFVDSLLRSIDRNPRVVRVIYANPKEEERLFATGRVRHIRSLRGWRPTPAWSLSNSTRLYAVHPPSIRLRSREVGHGSLDLAGRSQDP